MDVGPPELLIVLVIALVLFGGAKIPQLARSLGEAQREFRKGSSGEKDEPAETPAAVAPVVVAPTPSLPAATVVEPVVTPVPTEAPASEAPVTEAPISEAS